MRLLEHREKSLTSYFKYWVACSGIHAVAGFGQEQ
jgi:hypothetical protein